MLTGMGAAARQATRWVADHGSSGQGMVTWEAMRRWPTSRRLPTRATSAPGWLLPAAPSVGDTCEPAAFQACGERGEMLVDRCRELGNSREQPQLPVQGRDGSWRGDGNTAGSDWDRTPGEMHHAKQRNKGTDGWEASDGHNLAD